MICETCGEEIDTYLCPFCGTVQDELDIPVRGKKKSLRSINIKEDLPTVEVALQRVESELSQVRKSGYAGMKLIHGYGSQGSGGEIKKAVHQLLHRLYLNEEIQTWVPGEEFSGAYTDTLPVIKAFPFLQKDKDYRNNNRGISILIF